MALRGGPAVTAVGGGPTAGGPTAGGPTAWSDEAGTGTSLRVLRRRRPALNGRALTGGLLVAAAAVGLFAAYTSAGTREAAHELGITLRTLYRFIDEGLVPAYRFGRVIRLKAEDVERFIEASRIEPGSLEHLYPDLKSTQSSATEASGT